MTREEAIALRPQSAMAYWFELCIGALISVGLLAAVLLSQNLRAKRMESITVVFFLAGVAMAFQASERLFAPIRAAQRSSGLRDAARSQLHRIGSLCAGLGITIALIGNIARAMVKSGHGLFADMSIVGWLLYFVHPLLADLRGEKLYRSVQERMNIGAGQPIRWREWNPIRSDHWGKP